ncbi:MAG: hypothetical protein IKU89_01280 [Oscillospiraceae bacterium]|nr:hypothetical protein [Oscillospiraceae bacterium]
MAKKILKPFKKPSSKALNMLISAVLAFLTWLTLSVTAFPETSVAIKNVQIDYSLEGSYVDVAGISILSKSDETANLKIKGLRYIIGEYKADDVSISVNLDTVRAPGTYELPLVVKSNNGDEITVEEIVPSTVKIEFDYIVSREFSVENGMLISDISSLSAAPGYAIDSSAVQINPNSITIRGPKDHVDQITHCVARYNAGATVMSSIKNGAAELVLYSGENIFTSDKITISDSKLALDIPVYLHKDLDLNVSIKSYLDGFDISSLSYTIEPETIAVRSQSAKLGDYNSIHLGYIDLEDIIKGTTISLSIPQNDIYENVSGYDYATITFRLEGYTTKDVTIKNSQIYVVNVPQGYNINVIQGQISNITLVGPADVLESIEAGDVVAQIDFMNVAIPDSSYAMLNTKVYVPGYNNVWAYYYKPYQAYCEIQKVTDQATE